MKSLSLIIPAYNEEKRIKKTLEKYITSFNNLLKNKYEVIIILNGCIDNTLKIVRQYSRKYSFVKFRDYKERIGKGGAIREGFKIAKGDIIGFVDADSSTSPEEFLKLYNNLGDYDGIIASRWCKGALISENQSLIRIIAGRAFNLIIRIMFNMNYKDTQCGAKLFKKYAVEKIIDKIGLTKWAFDIDLLYLMKLNKFKIREFPTVWEHSQDSKFNLKRAALQMGLAIVRLRLYYSPFKFIAMFIDRKIRL